MLEVNLLVLVALLICCWKSEWFTPPWNDSFWCKLIFCWHSFFTCESSYCFQRVLAIAIPSVRPSHGWIRQKRCKLGSPNLHRRLPGRL